MSGSDGSLRGDERPADTLARIGALEPISRSELEQLKARRESYAAGQELCLEGEDADDLIIIVEGEAEALLETPLGAQRAALLGSGDIVGEISLIDGQPRSCSVIARGCCEALRIDLEHIGRARQASPALEPALLRTFCRSLARKVRAANDAMIEIMAPDGGEKRPGTQSSGERGAVDEATKREILREQGISDRELHQLLEFVQEQRFGAGDVIFSEGSTGDTLFIVADGQVRISRQVPGLGEEALAILGRGEIFGEMAWIDSRPRSADAIAHGGGCTVLGISRRHMETGTEGATAPDLPFLRVLCEILCRRIRAMNNQLVAWRTLSFRF